MVVTCSPLNSGVNSETILRRLTYWAPRPSIALSVSSTSWRTMRVAAMLFLAAASAASLEAQNAARVPQDSDSIATPKLYRDPFRAQLLGAILPGASHFYAGEYLRGYATWITTVVGIGMGPVIYDLDRCTFAFLSASKCNPGPKWPSHLLGAFMVGGGVWAWVSTARDAPHAAERANKRHQSRSLKAVPLVEPSADPDPNLRAGIAIRW